MRLFGDCDDHCSCDECQGIVWTSDPNWKPPTEQEIKEQSRIVKMWGNNLAVNRDRMCANIFLGR